MGGVKRDDITSENCELLSYEQGSYDSTSLEEEGGKGQEGGRRRGGGGREKGRERREVGEGRRKEGRGRREGGGRG